MPAKGNKRNESLLNDPQVNRWSEDVARGSRVTCDLYLRRFGSVIEDKNLSPRTIEDRLDSESNDSRPNPYLMSGLPE
jgi:hypothetical protein